MTGENNKTKETKIRFKLKGFKPNMFLGLTIGPRTVSKSRSAS